MITQVQTGRIRTWIADLGLRFRVMPTPADVEVGVLAHPVRYSPLLDDIGELPAVSCWRLRGEDDFHYKHRLALHLQEQVTAREFRPAARPSPRGTDFT